MRHVHESPWVMIVPLLVLAVGAAVLRVSRLRLFRRRRRARGFWKAVDPGAAARQSLAAADRVPSLIRYLPLLFGLAGLATAYVFYVADRRIPLRLVAHYRALYYSC